MAFFSALALEKLVVAYLERVKLENGISIVLGDEL
jgi:hypothetical protein